MTQALRERIDAELVRRGVPVDEAVRFLTAMLDAGGLEESRGAEVARRLGIPLGRAREIAGVMSDLGLIDVFEPETMN